MDQNDIDLIRQTDLELHKLFCESNVKIDNLKSVLDDLKDEIETSGKPDKYNCGEKFAAVEYRFILLRNQFNRIIDVFNCH